MRARSNYYLLNCRRLFFSKAYRNLHMWHD
jgi:hypothetical protein